MNLTTARWKLLHNSPLDDDEKKYLINLLSKEIGYPPPVDEAGIIDTTHDPGIVLPVLDKYAEIWKPGAPFSRNGMNHKGVIFHHTSGNVEGSIEWLTVDKEVVASYHVIIDEDGKRYRLVDDRYVAYHAGHGKIKGLNPNHVCLGIAFGGDTQTGEFRKTRELNNDEIESAVEFLRPRWSKFNLSHDWVTDHRTVEPNRRDDLAPDQLKVLQDRLKVGFK